MVLPKVSTHGNKKIAKKEHHEGKRGPSPRNTHTHKDLPDVCLKGERFFQVFAYLCVYVSVGIEVHLQGIHTRAKILMMCIFRWSAFLSCAGGCGCGYVFVRVCMCVCMFV